MSSIGKCLEAESRLVVARDSEEGVIRSDCLMGTGFPFGVMKMFRNQTEVVVAQHCECTKCQLIVHFKTLKL